MRMGFLGGRRSEEAELSARAFKADLPPLNADLPAAPLFPEPAFAPMRDAAPGPFDTPLFERSVPAEVTVAADIAALRDKIATALYDASKEYQMLCSLTHSGLTSCEQLSTELRRRLAGNVHYEVLRKLDEAYALASLVRGGLPPQ